MSDQISSSLYHLDTDKQEIRYTSTFQPQVIECEVLSSKLPLVSHSNVNLIATNSTFIAYANASKIGIIDHGQIEDHPSPVIEIQIRQDNSYLASISENCLQIHDLKQFCQIVFNLHRTDGKFERVIWHPKQQDFLATAVGNDVEIWQIVAGRDSEPQWYKLLDLGVQVYDLAFCPENENYITVALDKGVIKILTIDNEETIFEVNAHTFNLRMFRPSITVCHLPDFHILTSGKSQNELSLWNWEQQIKIHTLIFQANNEKLIQANSSSVVVADTSFNILTVVFFQQEEGQMKFFSLIEFQLSSTIQRMVRGAHGEILAIQHEQLIRIHLPGEKPNVQQQIQQVQEEISNRIANLDSTFQQLLQFNWIDKFYLPKAKQILENTEFQLCNLHLQQITDAVKETYQPQFDSGVYEIINQVNNQFSIGLREFKDKIHNNYQVISNTIEHNQKIAETLSGVATSLSAFASKDLHMLKAPYSKNNQDN